MHWTAVLFLRSLAQSSPRIPTVHYPSLLSSEILSAFLFIKTSLWAWILNVNHMFLLRKYPFSVTHVKCARSRHPRTINHTVWGMSHGSLWPHDASDRTSNVNIVPRRNGHGFPSTILEVYEIICRFQNLTLLTQPTVSREPQIKTPGVFLEASISHYCIACVPVLLWKYPYVKCQRCWVLDLNQKA